MQSYFKRLIILITGALLMSFGGSLLLLSNIGSDAILVFEQGFSLSIGFSPENIGYGVLIINAVLLIVMMFLDRKMLNIGTVIITILMGPVISLFLELDLIPYQIILYKQIITSLAGCIIISVGISLYLFANLGYAPFEGILICIQRKLKVRFSYIKIGADLVLFLLGWVLGGTIGIGSVFTIIIFGPLIDFLLMTYKKMSNTNRL